MNDLDDDLFKGFYQENGRPSYHPKMLLASLLFVYTQGIFSGRKIEKMMLENIAMQYLTRQLIVSYRTINRFRVSQDMEYLIRDLFIELNLRLKMEELITLDCLYINGTKIEANANKYTFVWKKATETFSTKLQEKLRSYFQDEIYPLIQEGLVLDEQEVITSQELAAFSQLLEEELQTVEQEIEEKPVKGKDSRKDKQRKLKKFFVK